MKSHLLTKNQHSLLATFLH